MRPSMGSVGDCYDNALCESFFATLECELLDGIVSALMPKRGWRSLTSSRAGTIPSVGIRRWTICHRPLRAAVSSLGLKPNYETVHEAG